MTKTPCVSAIREVTPPPLSCSFGGFVYGHLPDERPFAVRSRTRESNAANTIKVLLHASFDAEGADEDQVKNTNAECAWHVENVTVSADC